MRDAFAHKGLGILLSAMRLIGGHATAHYVLVWAFKGISANVSLSNTSTDWLPELVTSSHLCEGDLLVPEITVTNWFGNIVSHPQVIVDANTVEDIVCVLKDPAQFPSPVCAVGSNHSTSPCGVADG